MKKKILTVGIITALCGSMFLSSCIGSFQLTNKLLTWNRAISNKFVNELVFVAFWILPVYEVSGLADFLVINSIEFWSGTNPVAQGTFKIEGQNGEKFLVKCDGKGYNVINKEMGTNMRFDFNADTQEWSTDVNGERFVFLTFIDDTRVKLPTPDGGSVIVDASQEGLYAYQSIMNGTEQYAAR